MSGFGWSYPPGAASDPLAPWNQNDEPCAVCKRDPAECVCPECPYCGVQGDPLCRDAYGNMGDCTPRSVLRPLRRIFCWHVWVGGSDPGSIVCRRCGKYHRPAGAGWYF